jgi:transposase
VEDQALARSKKNAKKQGRVIVFVDESGLSERPTRVRTWAPKGQTPVVQYSFTWKQLSLIVGVSMWQFYFRLYPGTIKAPQCVEFLKALHRHIGCKILIIWDGLAVHKSRMVRDYLESTGGDVQMEFLPPYCPELNPAEYVFGHLKPHELGNFCPKHFSQLTDYARRRLMSMQRRSTLVRAFWKQAELPL